MKAIERKQGFTLIEIMIVAVVIIILCALMIPAFAKARDEQARANSEAVMRAIIVNPAR